jgi:DNA repair protein RadC
MLAWGACNLTDVELLALLLGGGGRGKDVLDLAAKNNLTVWSSNRCAAPSCKLD